MTLFSSFTYPEGKDLNAVKVITTPLGLLDFNLHHFLVGGYFPLWQPQPQCKKRLQGILTLCAALPKGARREHSAGNLMGYPVCKKAKACFISVLGESNLLKCESHCSLAIYKVPFRTEGQEKVFREMHFSTSLPLTSFSLVERFAWWTLANICRVNPDYFCCSTKPTSLNLGVSTIIVLEVKVLNFTFHAKLQFL